VRGHRKRVLRIIKVSWLYARRKKQITRARTVARLDFLRFLIGNHSFYDNAGEMIIKCTHVEFTEISVTSSAKDTFGNGLLFADSAYVHTVGTT